MHSPIPVPAAPARADNTSAAVRYVLWATLWLNLLSVAIKLTAGWLSGNLTVLTDGVHTILDASNNVFALAAIKLAWLPPDHNHPYGHRKFEALASLGIGAIMSLTAWEILRSIIRRFWTGAHAPAADVSALWVAMVAVGMVISLFITVYEQKRGAALRSTLLLADAAHTRSDILLTSMSLISLFVAPHYPLLDGVFSLAIVGFIFHTGWKILRENGLLLTDAAQMDPEPIREAVEEIDGVDNCHAIRSHGMPDDVHLDLHIVVAPEMTAQRTHEVERAVREALLARFPDVTEVAIHHQTHLPRTALPLGRNHAGNGEG